MGTRLRGGAQLCWFRCFPIVEEIFPGFGLNVGCPPFRRGRARAPCWLFLISRLCWLIASVFLRADYLCCGKGCWVLDGCEFVVLAGVRTGKIRSSPEGRKGRDTALV